MLRRTLRAVEQTGEHPGEHPAARRGDCADFGDLVARATARKLGVRRGRSARTMSVRVFVSEEAENQRRSMIENPILCYERTDAQSWEDTSPRSDDHMHRKDDTSGGNGHGRKHQVINNKSKTAGRTSIPTASSCAPKGEAAPLEEEGQRSVGRRPQTERTWSRSRSS